MGSDDELQMLRMSELCAAAGVSVGTVKHYLREGLLPKPVKSSRNMAYYSQESVERIKLIKRLQKDRFLPLKVIREAIDADQDEGLEYLRAISEIEDRILERALRGERAKTATRSNLLKRVGLPGEALDRLEDLNVVSPEVDGKTKRYGALDAGIVEAISRMRDSGFSEDLGFVADDLLLYREGLQKIVSAEVERFLSRLAGRVEPDKAVALMEDAILPLRDLISALHVKLLVSELQSQKKLRNEKVGSSV